MRADLFQVLGGFLAVLLVMVQQDPNRPPAPSSSPAVHEWTDTFDGNALDKEKWELHSLEGGNGRVEVKDGLLRLRGHSGWRAGVRTKQTFSADRFIVEATIGKVYPPLYNPNALETGNAILTILFDGSGRNRIEWILTTYGTFEAWSVIDGRGERLDNKSLATKLKNPTLGIVRKGDDFHFMLNGEEGLKKTIKNLPRTFHVMLYGFGSAENHWDSVRVVTVKQ